jgi:acyl-CoA synthetase (AMP-forming)/AMP-acid ligase II
MRLEAAAGVGVGSWIERRARIVPDRPALIAGSRSVTYAELAERIRRLAGGLSRLGVARGDRVAWIGPNHVAFLEAFFAVGRLGAVLAPVNHRLAPDERALVLEDTEPAVLLEHAMAPTRAPASLRHRFVVGGGAEADGAPPGVLDFEAFVASSPDRAIDERIEFDDLLFLPHTSGTTGRPKEVMLSHGNVTWNVINLLSSTDFRDDDVTIAIAPFFRVGGTGVNVLPVLFLGGTVIVPDDFGGDAILGLVERHLVTIGFGNPDSLDGLVRAERWPTADLSSIRIIITGGAPVPERLIRAFLDRGVPLVQGYGLSEAAPFVLLLDPGRALRKVGAAGRPPLFVEIRIVDPDGRDLDPGGTGELLVRGPNVMAGYWRRPAETAERLVAGGWLRTGDAARVDDDGDVWIVDRVDARFHAAGRTVYPGDVERVLMTHPSVADAGVVGIADPDGDATGAAFVVVLPGGSVSEAELLEFARGRLAAHEVPASITFVDALPRSSVGKLLRADLAARSEDAGSTRA